MKKILNVLIIGLILLSITSCKKQTKDTIKKEAEQQSDNVTITLDEYNKLKKGMSYEEVTKIIGGNCNKTEENTYYCSGDFAGTSATLIFENNKLKEKKQTNLE